MHNQPSAPAVRAQLTRLLQSNAFQPRRRLQNFLRFIVEETLAERDQGLKAYTIAVEVFGHDASFDPSDNPIVRVQASRLRQLLDDYYRSEGSRDEVIIDLPRGAYVPVFTFAETLSETEPSLPAGVADGSGAVAVLSVADVVNLTGAAERDYFCRSLTLELKNQLIRQHYLPVATGAENMRTPPAAFIIAGHVRGGGQRLRVTLMLQQTTSGAGLGSEEIECRLSDDNLLDKQQKIAARAAAKFASPHGVLCRMLRSGEVTGASESAALAAFRSFCERLSPVCHAQAKQALEQAIVPATTGADVWAALAQVYIAQRGFGLCDHDDTPAPLECASDAARQALILNPSGAMANTARALIHYHRGEHASFLSAVDDCLALDSRYRVDMLATLGMYLAYSGHRERGMCLLDEALRLNPACPTWHWLPRALNAYHAEDYEAALLDARRINLPGFFWDPLIRMLVCAMLDRKQELKDACRELLELKPEIFGQIDRLLINLFQSPALIDDCLAGFDKARALLADELPALQQAAGQPQSCRCRVQSESE